MHRVNKSGESGCLSRTSYFFPFGDKRTIPFLRLRVTIRQQNHVAGHIRIIQTRPSQGGARVDESITHRYADSCIPEGIAVGRGLAKICRLAFAIVFPIANPTGEETKPQKGECGQLTKSDPYFLLSSSVAFDFFNQSSYHRQFLQILVIGYEHLSVYLIRNYWVSRWGKPSPYEIRAQWPVQYFHGRVVGLVTCVRVRCVPTICCSSPIV